MITIEVLFYKHAINRKGEKEIHLWAKLQTTVKSVRKD